MSVADLMYSLVIPDMTIIDEPNTKAMSVMTSTRNDEMLIGHRNGNIYLWSFVQTIGSYIVNDNVPIVFIYPLNSSEFLSANKKGLIRIWNKYNCTVKKKFYVNWWISDYIVMLPNNLIAFSKFCPGRYLTQTVDVWDVKRGALVHTSFDVCSRARGMPLVITTAGYLVVARRYGKKMRIWDISDRQCKKICEIRIGIVFSLAALPTNEIVTAFRDIVIYKFTQRGEIYKSKVIEHRNIIDIIIPVSGYKFLTIDRSRNHAGVLKLWFSSSENPHLLGDSKYTGYPKLVSSWCNCIFSSQEGKLIVKHYYSDQLRFSTKLAEIRKNVRIMAQAVRTSSSLFRTLPSEILIKIALMTTDDMNQYEKQVSKEFAWTHFCRPHFCENFISEKRFMRDSLYAKKFLLL